MRDSSAERSWNETKCAFLKLHLLHHWRKIRSANDSSDMANPPLDAMDRKIVRALQRAGRASNVELAAEVHLSAPQCFRRTRALEERGGIRGYAAQVDPEALGYGVTAY